MLLNALKTLTQASPAQEPARLFDIWRNAERRAAQGRYDDAVARVYRLLEWSAQWLLRTHCGIDTAAVPADRIPEGITLTVNRKGQHQAGLFVAWQLVEQLTSGPASAFAKTHLEAMRGRVEVRNQSILAHGFTPIAEAEWTEFSQWIKQHLMPMLLQETASLRIREMPPQLPKYPLEFAST
ncbi:MAG: TIGR02710 family CRISPR-associated CARF protein [Candidatus Competibacteraceae bacterium]